MDENGPEYLEIAANRRKWLKMTANNKELSYFNEAVKAPKQHTQTPSDTSSSMTTLTGSNPNIYVSFRNNATPRS